LALSEFLSRGFTDKHPDVIRTREEIALLEKSTTSADRSGRLNPLAQQTEAMARRSEGRRKAAQTEIERLSQVADEIQTQLNSTPAVAKQLDALKVEYEHLFNTFQDFAKRHNEAVVQAQLERRQLGEQFRVLESAFAAPEPSAPNRALILILGALFAMMVGLGVGILFEALDTSPHDARQLQTRLALPVLATIPAIWLESDRLRQRRSLTRTALATAAVVLVALVGGAANYLWVNGAPSILGGEEEEKPAAGKAAPAPTPAAPRPKAAVPGEAAKG
ncbi:MAG: hypothetical protein ACREI7_06270, partial [Myxococcota bacterium]